MNSCQDSDVMEWLNHQAKSTYTARVSGRVRSLGEYRQDHRLRQLHSIELSSSLKI